ncbi:MAG: ribosomal RNA small subunit methyltransferase A [Parachlamydia sp.]|nr:MAG: ribosomal RNA small subunit methyltransferase A [Parachlamydia sp.]
MPLYKPQELFAFLNSLGIRPKKGLSQNFLIDGNILQKIISAAEVSQEDVILEIGPGPGALTECLLEQGCRVIAVEKDLQLGQALERLQTPLNTLSIYCEDILQFPLEQVLPAYLKAGQKAKVIANLPYQLTTSILARLAPLNHLFSSITVMVQEEVARRFTGSPGSREYGSFTVFLNFFSDPVFSFKVSRKCFFPIPNVDSAVMTLRLKKPPADIDQEQFFTLTRKAFEQRRKMLKSTLRELYDPAFVSEELIKLGLSPLARPEELSVENFIELFKSLQKV